MKAPRIKVRMEEMDKSPGLDSAKGRKDRADKESEELIVRLGSDVLMALFPGLYIPSAMSVEMRAPSSESEINSRPWRRSQ